MPADEIPLEISQKLRWLPHLPYHTRLEGASWPRLRFWEALSSSEAMRE